MIFPGGTCDPDEIILEKFSCDELCDPSNFIDWVKMIRPADEILDMNDLYYRFNWACVGFKHERRENMQQSQLKVCK